MSSVNIRPLSREEIAFQVLRYLQSQVTGHTIVHKLMTRDIERWSVMDDDQRRLALERNAWRAGAVAPWTTGKRCVRSAIEAMKGSLLSRDMGVER